ncbi:hypothetical protein AB2G02_26135 (plasmid) [Escherichia coli]
MIQGQAVEAACQPARTPWQAGACRKGKRATLARRPLPFPSVMCLTQECFFLDVMELFLMLLLFFFFICCSDSDYCRVVWLSPGRTSAPGCWRRPVVRPDPTGSCWRTR